PRRKRPSATPARSCPSAGKAANHQLDLERAELGLFQSRPAARGEGRTTTVKELALPAHCTSLSRGSADLHRQRSLVTHMRHSAFSSAAPAEHCPRRVRLKLHLVQGQ